MEFKLIGRKKKEFKTDFKNSLLIAKKEFFYNLKSWRMFVIFIIFSLMLLGGAYGLSTLATNNDIPKMQKVNQGPNVVLYVLTTPFVWLIAPLIAILLSYDSIVTERLENSLDFLLSRPVSRKGIAFGKFLGLLLALSLPVIIVSIIGIVIIAHVSGKSPLILGCIGFVFFTVVYIAIFILIQQIISTISKNIGTTLVIGVCLWLLFTIFWLLIPLGYAKVCGIPYDPTSQNVNTTEYAKLSNRFDLFSPSGIYPLCVGALLGKEVSDFSYGVPNFAPFVGIAIWFFSLLYISMEIFDRKI